VLNVLQKMILEENEAAREHKAEAAKCLKASINRIFIRMSPAVILVCALVHSYDGNASLVWVSAVVSILLLYGLIRYLIYAGYSRKEVWALGGGKVKRRGELSLKLSQKTIVSVEELRDFEGYYRLCVGGLHIILSERDFPQRKIVSFVKRETTPETENGGEQSVPSKSDRAGG